ncbi:HmuY family protein [Sinomicrobium sp. M5D2P9]
MKRFFISQILVTGLLIAGCSSDDDSPGTAPEVPVVESATVDVESGGPNQPNQVYIDLSTSETTVVKRDTWELGFYSGSQNRVFLNAAILVTAAELPEFTDIDAVNSNTVFETSLQLKSLNPNTGQTLDVSIHNVEELKTGLPLGYGMYGDLENEISFTDSKEGTLSGTTIAEVSSTESNNKVYIISAGSEIPTETPDPGEILTTGDHRGFYKIRILTDGNSYTLQYAELDATTHEEVVITKEDSYNIKAFSIVNGTEVAVEPAKEEWDINFTSVFSYYGRSMRGLVAGAAYSDYALHNTLGNVGLYTVFTAETTDGETVETGEPSFEEFTRADVKESEFEFNDRAVIGSDWRQTASFGGTAQVRNDRYFVVKDAAGNYYKLQFTAFMNASGQRGYPQFKYELLE